MIRVVLDVNVLVSAFPSERGVLSEVLDAWTNRAYELVVSEHILGQMVRAWNKPYYQSRYTSERVHSAIALVRAKARLVVPVDTVQGVADDEEDDLVLATAVAGQVPYLVTGDYGLQRIGRYGDVTILSPRAFLDVLAEAGAWLGEPEQPPPLPETIAEERCRIW